MTSNEIKAARSKASQSNPATALADSGGFLDDSVLAAIRQVAARLNPRQSARKPAASHKSSASHKPSVGRHAGPVRNRPHFGRQAPPKHAAA
jgi:hypothetical protein